MRKMLLAVSLVVAIISPAKATRYPLLGGPGLVHVQSAKVSPGFGFRTVNAACMYGAQSFFGTDSIKDYYIDFWSHNFVSYAPIRNLGVTLNGLAHAEKWTYENATSSQDATLGCPGDVAMSVKYSYPLKGGMIDLALMPVFTLPLGNLGTDPMGKAILNDPPSQTGKLDFGAKVLADFNLGRFTLYVNTGYMTRGDQRAQVPFGIAGEYGISSKFSAFLEASGEMRMGSVKDTMPRTWYPKGIGFDRNEIRATPGLRFVPMDLLAVNLSADLGLSDVTAPWQIILGIDFPASAGRAAQALITGGVAGLIKDRDSQVPMKGMITFPGSDIPGLVSDNMGTYLAQLKPGEYKVHIYANGYRWLERKISVEPGKTLKWDLTLKRKLGTIAGKVVDAATGMPVAAILTFVGSSKPELRSDPATGDFSTQVPPGKYKLSAMADGFQSQEYEFTVRDKAEINQIVSLRSLTMATTPAGIKTPTYPPKPPRGTTRPETTPATTPATTPTTTPASPAPKPEPKPAAPAPAKPSADEIAAMYKSGVQQYMNEDYKGAEATFKKVLKADPGHAKAKEYLGKARDRLKKLK